MKNSIIFRSYFFNWDSFKRRKNNGIEAIKYPHDTKISKFENGFLGSVKVYKVYRAIKTEIKLPIADRDSITRTHFFSWGSKYTWINFPLNVFIIIVLQSNDP